MAKRKCDAKKELYVERAKTNEFFKDFKLHLRPSDWCNFDAL